MNNWYICWFFMHPLNAELNPICHLLALLGGATIVVVSRLRVNINTTGWTPSKLNGYLRLPKHTRNVCYVTRQWLRERNVMRISACLFSVCSCCAVFEV